MRSDEENAKVRILYKERSFTPKLLFAITGGVCLFLVARYILLALKTATVYYIRPGIVLYPPAINHRVDEWRTVGKQTK